MDPKLKTFTKLLLLAMFVIALMIFAFAPPTSAHIKCPEGTTLYLVSVPNPFEFTLNANGETYTRIFTHDEFIAIINSGE